MAEEVRQQEEVQADFSYLFLKITVNSPKTNSKGVAIIQVNYDTHRIEKIETVHSLSTQYDQTLTADSGWFEYFDYITRKKFDNSFNRSVTMDLTNSIQKIIGGVGYDTAVVKDIIRFHEKKKHSHIKELFNGELVRVLYDKELELDIGTEFVLQHEIDNHYNAKKQTADQQKNSIRQQAFVPKENFFQLNPDSILIESAPVVAPVSGVPIFNVKPGMDIMVKLNNTTAIGNKYNNYFNLIEEDGRILPLKGTVEKVKFDTDGHNLLVHFRENIYGKIIETEQVKVKLFQPVNEEIQVEEKKSKAMPILAIVFALMIILVAYLAINYLL